MQNFQQYVNDYISKAPDASDTVLKDIQNWKDIQSNLSELSEEKKIRSAEIGRKKKQGLDFKEDIEAIAVLKKNIKGLKDEQKSIQERVLSSTAEKDEPIPARFNSYTQTVRDLSSYKVIKTSDVNQKIIDDYVTNHSASSLYHLCGWRDIIVKIFGHTDISLAAVDDENSIVGYLPLIHMKSVLFGNFCSSLPFYNYGGPLADTDEIALELVAAAKEMTKALESEHIELRETRRREDMPSRMEKVSMLLKLPENVDELEKNIGTKLRAQIKRSQHTHPLVKFGKEELLDDFYEVFSVNMRDLGTPVYDRNLFYEVIRFWKEEAYVTVIYIDEKPVSAAILLGYKDTMEIPWASALRSTNRIGINMFMYWNILCHAIQQGYQYFDFGRSSVDSGTFRFKQQWGAVPVQNYWNYCLSGESSLPQINPNNPKYKFFISIWKRLPVAFTRLIGPHIVKNIP